MREPAIEPANLRLTYSLDLFRRERIPTRLITYFSEKEVPFLNRIFILAGFFFSALAAKPQDTPEPRDDHPVDTPSPIPITHRYDSPSS